MASGSDLIFDWLLDEHGMVDVSYSVVRSFVAARRPQIDPHRGWSRPGGRIRPADSRPGAEADADFGEVMVRLRGELV